MTPPPCRLSWIPLVFLMVLQQLACGPERSWPEEPFDAEVWKAAPKNARYRLTRSLQAQHILDGLSRDDVVSKLGGPDYEAPDGRYVTYLVKTRDKADLGFSLDAIYLLHVRFDAEGRVDRVVVRGD